MAIMDMRIAHLAIWTLTSRSSAMGDGDAVLTGDGDPEQRPVTRIEQFGFRGRRPSGLRAFSFRVGSSTVIEIGIAPSKGYSPVDLDEGETAWYNAFGVVCKLDSDGKVNLGQNGGLGSNDGLVHGTGVDPFTGVSYATLGNQSDIVRGKK